MRRQNARPVNRIAVLFNLNVRFLSTKNWGYFHRRYGYLAKPKVYEIKRTFFFSSGGDMPEYKDYCRLLRFVTTRRKLSAAVICSAFVAEDRERTNG